MTPAERALAVKRQAAAIGFDSTGITTLEPSRYGEALGRWLRAGYGGRMTYLGRQARKRAAPSAILPGAHRAVVTLTNYYHGPEAPGAAGRIAQYARGTDYHAVLGPRLEALGDAIRAVCPGARTRCYADAGPVPERELAARAGLGWMGKNTLLIHPRIGSFTFIGVVLTDADLAPDLPFAADRCGSCQRCVDACPTEAFVAPRELDARRCISYLPIERRGAFTSEEAGLVGDWVFGCDVCQDVCPWNERFARPTDDPALAPRPDLEAALATVAALDEEGFQQAFGATALARAGRDGLARNVAAARRNREGA